MGRPQKLGVIVFARIPDNTNAILEGMMKRDRRTKSQLIGFALEEFVNRRFGQTVPAQSVLPADCEVAG